MEDATEFENLLSLKLGVSDIEIELQTRAETRHATDMLVNQAFNNLEIFSRDLDPLLYDRDTFLEAVRQLCLRNRKVQLRVLVQDPVSAIKRNNRFIELARKFSSSIEIRQPHEDYHNYNEAFLLADNCGIIHRTLADRNEGIANFHDPVKADRLLRFFTEVWDRSESHPELRRLYI